MALLLEEKQLFNRFFEDTRKADRQRQGGIELPVFYRDDCLTRGADALAEFLLRPSTKLPVLAESIFHARRKRANAMTKPKRNVPQSTSTEFTPSSTPNSLSAKSTTPEDTSEIAHASR